MENVIKLKKGLDIVLQGKADGSLSAPISKHTEYAVKPADFYGVRPKLLVKEQEVVLAGTPLFYDKNDERIRFSSPVSGTISQIIYGEKRKVEEIRLVADAEIQYVNFSSASMENLNKEKVQACLLEAGLWSFIRQRPYNRIANPDRVPKAIFISGFDTTPLACDIDMIVHGRGEAFQAGIDAIRHLTLGKVHLNLHTYLSGSNVLKSAKNVDIHWFEGPHPCGNVGVQVHHIDPLNKGEEIWFVHPQDVITIGRLFLTGKYDATKVVALAGSEVVRTSYHRVIAGLKVDYLLRDNLKENKDIRIISGNVFTGKNIGYDGYLGAYDHCICAIPEGNRYRFLGWITLGLNLFSFSRTFFSWLTPNTKYRLDTNLNGGRRALVVTGQFERVFPMDIYPNQLIKACITKDIEAMENLGIYEVDPEDFALCEYIDTSKTEIQQIIREGLELVYEENK